MLQSMKSFWLIKKQKHSEYHEEKKKEAEAYKSLLFKNEFSKIGTSHKLKDLFEMVHKYLNFVDHAEVKKIKYNRPEYGHFSRAQLHYITNHDQIDYWLNEFFDDKEEVSNEEAKKFLDFRNFEKFVNNLNKDTIEHMTSNYREDIHNPDLSDL